MQIGFMFAAVVAALVGSPVKVPGGEVPTQIVKPLADGPIYRLPPMPPPSGIRASAAGDAQGYGLALLNVPAAWQTATGKGVVVAILDTGIAQEHRDLKAQIVGVKDFTGSRFGAADQNGHGTHCAGIVAAARNEWGLVGVAPDAKVRAVKVLGDDGSGAVTWIAAGIDHAIAAGDDVVSMSLGSRQSDSYIPPALARAEAAGLIVVAAAGNDGPGDATVGYPGGYATVVACVAAVDGSRNVARFSSRGPAVSVAAPGVDIESTYPGPGDGLQAKMSGTSMATPHVAGLAALWVQANPQVPKKDRPAAFRAALKAACADLPPTGRDTASGWGLPDAVKLVGKAVVPPPPGNGPITFTEADFTEAGKVKWKKLGLSSITLNPPGVVSPSASVPVAPPLTFEAWPVASPVFGGCPGGVCPRR